MNNRSRLIQCIIVGIALLSQGKSMAADVDVLSWESIRETRPGFYEVLMLSSFNELRKQQPEAVKITRIAVLPGWGPEYAFTLFEQKSERSVMIEIASYHQVETSVPERVLRMKLKEEKDIQNAALFMTQTLGSLKWTDAPSKENIPDDGTMIMFEKFEQNAGHYFTKVELPRLSSKALAGLRSMAERYSKLEWSK